MTYQSLALFEQKEIRKITHNDEWWFSIVDIVRVLTEQDDRTTARKYWNKLAERLRKEGSELVTNCHQLKMKAEDGKMRLTDCANTETLLRIIQSIPSPKAEPFKRWLAGVGYKKGSPKNKYKIKTFFSTRIVGIFFSPFLGLQKKGKSIEYLG